MLTKKSLVWRSGVCSGLVALVTSSPGFCGPPGTDASGVSDVATIMKISPPVLIARPVAQPVKIDGELSEAAWESAVPVGSFTLVLDTSMSTQYPTTVRSLWDDDNLYLSMVCNEPNVDRLVTLAEKRDEGSGSDDRVEILIDPNAPGGEYYEFILTGGNVQSDARCKALANKVVVYTPSGPLDALKPYHESEPEWNAKWSSAVAKGAEQWTAEIAIPFRDLGIDPADQRVLRVNFGRIRVTYSPSRWRGRQLNVKPEHSAWAIPKGDFHTPALFGFLGLADADGKAPPIPKELEVAVPGLPGLPGVPNDDVPPKRLRFTVHTDRPGREFTRFWDSVNASWLPPEFLDLTYAKGYMRQIRCGGGPRSRRSRTRPTSRPTTGPGARSRSRPRWRRGDTLETVKAHNIRAVVTLRGRPAGIRYRSIRNARWGRVTGPPESDEDYKIIYEAYREYFQELYDRHGKEFFDSLRFEFWNEPDGSNRFFAGTVDDYCKWYDWVAKALKDVSPTGKIGGPAVTGGGFDFTKAFLDHCRDGANAATGGKGAPLDFVSFHVYGWRWQLAPMASYDPVYTLVRFWKIMHDAGFGGIETHVTEWGVEPTGNASGPYFWFRKTHYAPVWMAKLVKDFDDAKKTYAHMNGRIDGLSICLAGMMTRRSPFAGNRTLFVDNWVPKPYYNGYVLLNELGEKRLEADGPEQDRVGCLPTRRSDGSLAILVYHFKEYARTSPPAETITVELVGIPLEGKKIAQMRVDENTSNSYTAWVKMGSPDEITDEIAEKLKAAAKVHKLPVTTADGLAELTMPVNSVAVVLVENRQED